MRSSKIVGHALLVTAFAVGAADCDRVHSSPTAPAAASAAPVQPAATPFVLHLTGVVRDEHDVAVAGATISNGVESAVSDAQGHYDITIRREMVGPPDILFNAGKDGYEAATFYQALVNNNPDATRNVRMYRISRVTPGASADLKLMGDGAVCGFDDEFLCRRIRVIPPASGTVTMSVISDRVDVNFEVAIDPLTFPYPRTSSLTLHATAGAEMVVDVLAPWNASGPIFFTFTTSFAP